MARVVVIRHEVEPHGFDRFMMNRFLDGLAKRGHEIVVTRGVNDLPEADMAIVHVNRSVVPHDYAAAAARYPIVLNGKALDIRKRNVSRNILAQDTDWTGPVIMKTDLNFSGWPEWIMHVLAEKTGSSPIEAERPVNYRIFPRRADVEDWIWSEPRLIVERFLPEHDEGGFYTRFWVFVGDAGRCARCRSAQPIIKGGGIIDVEYVEVPEFIRAERQRLGLDFGKLDFVIHNGEPVLLDANKTPGQPPGASKAQDRSAFIDALEAPLIDKRLPV